MADWGRGPATHCTVDLSITNHEIAMTAGEYRIFSVSRLHEIHTPIFY